MLLLQTLISCDSTFKNFYWKSKKIDIFPDVSGHELAYLNASPEIVSESKMCLVLNVLLWRTW